MRSLFFAVLITGMVYHGHGPHVAVMAGAICLATAALVNIVCDSLN
jgi:hypothetical protein